MFFCLVLCLSLFWPWQVKAAQISVNTGMSFGLIEFASMHQGTLALGSNGVLLLNGNGLSYLGGAIPGQITVNGDSGVVELRCSATSTLGGSDNGSLNVINIEASVGSGVDSGMGTPCTGTASTNPDAIIIDLASSPDPRVYFGGTLDIPANSITKAQDYDSSGGASLSISAVFQ